MNINNIIPCTYLQNLELIENIDLNIVDKLINSNLLQTVSWECNGIVFENEKQQLMTIKQKIKNNKLKVVYKKSKYLYGRVFPFKGLSLCSLRRQIRQTLCYNTYIDIDIENCHPQLLKQICEHNEIYINYLKQYTDNREQILNETINTYKCTREDAKLLFIRLSYFGSFTEWVQNFDNKTPTEFIKNYMKELKTIGALISNENPELLKVVKTLKKQNEIGSLVSIFLQEKECLILENVFQFLKFHNIIKNNCVLCFDGIMILKENYKPELLNEISEYINSKLGFKLKFTEKEMKEHLIKELENIEINNNINIGEFELKKNEFELNHCKIINKGIYIKTTNNDNIIMSKKQIKEAYEHITINDENKKKKIFIDLWISGNDNIKHYDDLDIFPYPLKCPDNIFNMWTPFEMEKINNYTPNNDALNIILNHIKILCNNEDNIYNYFIKWIGQLIQYPAIKTIVPTLISKEGAGKGTLINLITLMLGENKCLETTTPNRDVWGNFNSCMVNKYFINLNELSKKDTVEAEGKIKGLITDKSLTINSKGINQYNIKSYHRFLITTNNEDPVKTSNTDRRNLIIRSSDELIGKKEYFNKLYKLLDDVNVIKTVYEYFKSIPDLDKFNLLTLPSTDYQDNLRLLNLTVLEQFIIDLTSHYNGIIERTGKEIYEEFVLFKNENNIDYETTPQKIGIKLINLKIDGITKGRHTKVGDTKYYDIDKIKKHFKISENLFDTEEEINNDNITDDVNIINTDDFTTEESIIYSNTETNNDVNFILDFNDD